MANALASLRLRASPTSATSAIPTLHPVFRDFAGRARVITIAERRPHRRPGVRRRQADARQDHQTLVDVNWGQPGRPRRPPRAGHPDRSTRRRWSGCVNWTMLPKMGEIWEQAGRREVLPATPAPGAAGPCSSTSPTPRNAPARTSAGALEHPVSRFQEHGRRDPRPQPEGGGPRSSRSWASPGAYRPPRPMIEQPSPPTIRKPAWA